MAASWEEAEAQVAELKQMVEEISDERRKLRAHAYETDCQARAYARLRHIADHISNTFSLPAIGGMKTVHVDIQGHWPDCSTICRASQC